MSSATRSSRKVAARRAARGVAARAAGRGRTGSARCWRSKPCRLVRWPCSAGNPALERSQAQDASLAAWTPRPHHHHALSAGHLRGALGAVRIALAAAARLALDVALPTLCVSCREPVDGEGVCAACWAKLSFIAPPFCPRLGIPFVYDPGPELLSMEAIANPPAYQRARAAVRYDDVARTLVHALKYQDRTDLAPADGPLDGARGPGIARRGRHAGAGSAALAARLEPPLQPVRRARARDFAHRAASKAGVRGAAAGRRDRAAGRSVARPARQQCAGRVQGRRRPHRQMSRAAA